MRFTGSDQRFNDKVNNYLEATPGRSGLPLDALREALIPYYLKIPREVSLEETIDQSELILRENCKGSVITRRCSDLKEVVSISVLHTSVGGGGNEPYFTLMCDTLIFLPDEFWLLQVMDPAFFTGHLIRRLQRGTPDSSDRDFADLHDDVSILLPAFLKVAFKRFEERQEPLSSHFITPLGDGLAFGDFQLFKNANSMRTYLTKNKAGDRNTIELRDNLDSDSDRMMFYMRTVFDASRLNASQRRVRSKLRTFVEKWRKVLDALLLTHRFAIFSTPCGNELKELLPSPNNVSEQELLACIQELDSLMASSDWTDQANRSKQATDKDKI